jgi:hypothetical protein
VLDLLQRSSNNRRNRLKEADFVAKSTSTLATVPRLLSSNTFTTNTLLMELDTTPTITSTDSTNVELTSSTTSVDNSITTNTQLITHDTTSTFTTTDPTFTTLELASSSFLDPIPADFSNVSTTTDDETTILTPIEFGIDILPETNMNSFQTSTLNPTISVTEPIPSTTPTLFETFPLTVPTTSNKNWTNMDSFIPLYNVSENANVTNTTLEPSLKTDLLLNKTVENDKNFFTFVRNFLTKCKILLLVATLIRPNITLETRLRLRAALGIVLAG